MQKPLHQGNKREKGKALLTTGRILDPSEIQLQGRRDFQGRSQVEVD
jgi:hypothetical protein